MDFDGSSSFWLKISGFRYFDNDYQLDRTLNVGKVEWVDLVGKFEGWGWSRKKKKQFDSELFELIYKMLIWIEIKMIYGRIKI